VAELRNGPREACVLFYYYYYYDYKFCSCLRVSFG